MLITFTRWGQSAGAISVNMHMLAYHGSSDELFRGAFMQSGGPIDTGNLEDGVCTRPGWRAISDRHSGQPFFDKFATDAGCENSLGSAVVFDCLRNASVADIRFAIQASENLFGYSSVSLPWKPRVDGIFLTDLPQRLVLSGSVADVPFVTGALSQTAS